MPGHLSEDSQELSMANVQTAAGAPEALWRQAPIGELVDLGRTFRGPLALSRLHTTPKGVLSRREGVLLGVLVLVLHGAVIYWVNQNPPPALPIVPPEIPPMTIEFSRPAPPVVETPPPPPKPIPKPKPVVKPVPKPVAKPVAQPPAPAQPVAAPAPPAPPAPKPVTPASANAG